MQQLCFYHSGIDMFTLRINYLSLITIILQLNAKLLIPKQSRHLYQSFLFGYVLCDLCTDICCIWSIDQSIDPLPKNLFLENIGLYNYAGYLISMYWVYLSVSHRYMYFTTYYRQRLGIWSLCLQCSPIDTDNLQ